MPSVSERLSLSQLMPVCSNTRKFQVGWTSSPRSSGGNSVNTTPVQEIRPDTVNSADHDLITAEEVDYQFPLTVYKVKTAHHGPIPKDTVGLILPRSSISAWGLFIVPGVIDGDYEGSLIIQTTYNIPQALPAGEPITQLLLLPLTQMGPSTNLRNGSFGSICCLNYH